MACPWQGRAPRTLGSAARQQIGRWRTNLTRNQAIALAANRRAWWRWVGPAAAHRLHPRAQSGRNLCATGGVNEERLTERLSVAGSQLPQRVERCANPAPGRTGLEATEQHAAARGTERVVRIPARCPARWRGESWLGCIGGAARAAGRVSCGATRRERGAGAATDGPLPSRIASRQLRLTRHSVAPGDPCAAPEAAVSHAASCSKLLLQVIWKESEL